MIDNSVNPGPDTQSGGSDEGNEDSDSGVKVYAKLSTLHVDGQAPEVGDEVDLTVKGKVDSIDGDVACVVPTEVNGEPAPKAPDSDSDNEDMEDTRQKLMAGAQQDDANGSAY